MKMKVVVLVLILTAKSLATFAQDNQSEDAQINILDKASLGLGIGMDHGGLGANIYF